jgi:hypothetical protein
VNDELQWRINEHVLNGDAPSIIWAMERQIRINTELEARLAELERREALLTERMERIGKGCMLAIACIEAVPYWNGIKQVSAYEAFERYWIGTLQSEDMTYLRGLMGVPEPNTPEGQKWMEAQP